MPVGDFFICHLSDHLQVRSPKKQPDRAYIPDGDTVGGRADFCFRIFSGIEKILGDEEEKKPDLSSGNGNFRGRTRAIAQPHRPPPFVGHQPGGAGIIANSVHRTLVVHFSKRKNHYQLFRGCGSFGSGHCHLWHGFFSNSATIHLE